jgi:hypothetical protein
MQALRLRNMMKLYENKARVANSLVLRAFVAEIW